MRCLDKQIKDAECPHNWISEGKPETQELNSPLLTTCFGWLGFFLFCFVLAQHLAVKPENTRVTVLNAHLCNHTTVWVSGLLKWLSCLCSWR